MGDEDKQFEASHQKLEKARKEGQVVKSKDFSTAVSMVVLFIFLFKIAPFIWDQLTKLFVLIYEQIPNRSLSQIGLAYLLFTTLLPTILIIGPVLLLAWAIAILADFIQVGPLVTMTPLMPKLDKLNPMKYFKNLMSSKTIVELVKNIIKVVILTFVGFMVYKEHFPMILNLVAVDNIFAILVEFGNLILEFIIKAGLAFFIIAAGDYMYNKWKFLKDQKMSFKEVKDEYKNSEGDPHVKQALRQKRMQLLQQGHFDSVAEADFVVTNPTHIACALKYKQEEMEAPIMLVKGADLYARKMTEMARSLDIPVIENPPVARALYRMVDVGKEVPPELYKAVAEILIFVYNLRNSQKSGNIEEGNSNQ